MSEIDMMTRYYLAKEREENVVIEINNAYVEVLEALEAVEAENAKLCELANAMVYCMQGKCLECPMCSPFDTSIGGAPECRATLKLRELGIEVEG